MRKTYLQDVSLMEELGAITVRPTHDQRFHYQRSIVYELIVSKSIVLRIICTQTSRESVAEFGSTL